MRASHSRYTQQRNGAAMSGTMSFRHQWVLEIGRNRRLSAGARLLGIMAINEYGKPHRGAEFWPSHKALAELVGVSERTVGRHISELVKAGVMAKRSGGVHRSNRYVALSPNQDDGGQIEARVRSDGGAKVDTGDGSDQSQLTNEQIQEQIHSEQIQCEQIKELVDSRPAPSIGHAPCFCHEGESCADCSGGEEHLATTVLCEPHLRSLPCEYCLDRQRLDLREEQFSEDQLRQWHEEQNRSEGLTPDGDGPNDRQKPAPYQRRWR